MAREACDEGEGEEDGEEKRVGRELDSTRLGGGGENVPEVEVAALGLASAIPTGCWGSLLLLSLSLSLCLPLV